MGMRRSVGPQMAQANDNSNTDQNGQILCSVRNSEDLRLLHFGDFCTLMHRKIDMKMEQVEANTVFEAKEETVSCGLWPLPTRFSHSSDVGKDHPVPFTVDENEHASNRN